MLLPGRHLGLVVAVSPGGRQVAFVAAVEPGQAGFELGLADIPAGSVGSRAVGCRTGCPGRREHLDLAQDPAVAIVAQDMDADPLLADQRLQVLARDVGIGLAAFRCIDTGNPDTHPWRAVGDGQVEGIAIMNPRGAGIEGPAGRDRQRVEGAVGGEIGYRGWCRALGAVAASQGGGQGQRGRHGPAPPCTEP